MPEDRRSPAFPLPTSPRRPAGFATLVAHALANTHLLPDEDMGGLVELALHFERVGLRGGERLFEQGDDGDGWYMVLSGTMGIVRDEDGQNVQLLDHLEAPESFGEMALIDGAPRMATAEAVDDVVLAHMPRHAFDGLLATGNPVAVSLLRAMSGVLCRRHRQLIGVMQDLVAFDDDEQPPPSAPSPVLEALLKSTTTWH